MASSVNNWLGFSLSPQDQQQMVNSQSSIVDNFTSDSISDSGECFDLDSNSSIPSLNLPPPFGLLESYQNHHDWNMKGGPELSVFMTSDGSCNQNPEIQTPKFENFLNNVGTAGSFIYQLPLQAEEVTDVTTTTTTATSSIGLSMIKNWLRNNPTPSNRNPTTNELSLSMGGGGDSSLSSDNKRQQMEVDLIENGGVSTEAVPRKSIDTFGQRTSIYRGVTRHRWTGRYEAHLWDNSCRREGQVRKGRQGGYDKEDKAARAYDLAALKYWGTTTTTNFPISTYEKEIDEMKNKTRQEYVASLRRKSSGFSRGASIYRGVTRHHQHGRWQARIGRVAGNKDLYLGTFGTQEEAAEAYDIAAIKFRGLNAVTNFEINRYDVKCILESTTLPIGGAAKRLKDAAATAAPGQSLLMIRATTTEEDHLTTQLTRRHHHHHHEAAAAAAPGINIMTWPSSIGYQHQPPFSMLHYPQQYNNTSNQQPPLWCKQEQQNAQSSFQDLHQFYQPAPNSSSVLHNLMSMNSSTEQTTYSTGEGDHHQVIGFGTDGYTMANANTTTTTTTNFNSSQDGDRDLYYHHQQGSAAYYGGWVPTLAARTTDLEVAHGSVPSFTGWNDGIGG
ncbi:hypothetical protein SSX86_023871 [Deinandra increscens subsp. villosa]|uniref:AP2/ERF domain-containing protein n=1 Tax=Deinandra increscens subsp. villosa TaxID=3103831 RepID=A0AAP0CGN6_9ASTR